MCSATVTGALVTTQILRSDQFRDDVASALDADALRTLRFAVPAALVCLAVEAGGHLVLEGFSLLLVGIPLGALIALGGLLVVLRRCPEALPGPSWWILAPWGAGVLLTLTHETTLTLVLMQAGLLMVISALTSRVPVWLLGVSVNATSLAVDASTLAGIWGAVVAVFFVAMGGAVFFSHRETILGSVRRSALEQAVRARDDQIERLERLSGLAAGFSHHFNNHLTTMLGSIDLARASLPAAASAREDLDAAERAGRAAAELVQTIRIASAREDEAQRDARIPTPGADLVDEADLRAALPGTVELALEVDGPLPSVDVDAAAIRTALRHLIRNAGEACAEQGGGRVLVHASGHDDRLVLEVVDDGPGYDAAHAELITELFFTTREPTRAGLGLPYVVGVAHRHGGHLDHESRPGHTRFSLRLPVPP
jgi:signal transduction histidine kinase